MDENLKLLLEENLGTWLTLGIWTIVGIVLLSGFLTIFRKIRDKRLLKTVTKSNRGTWSERNLVLKLLKSGIPAQTIFHDLYLRKPGGHFSQIDLVVATRVGIIVFEVKDYSGWIFGDGRYTQWTQVLAYGKQKYRFYNPIKQNNKHIEDLKNLLRPFGNVPFYSIVVFYGDCVLKEIGFVPDGTFIVRPARVKEVMKIIIRNNEPAQYSDKLKSCQIVAGGCTKWRKSGNTNQAYQEH
ncbi:MAG: NERD domain-containing protein [Marinilabiliales bacterium]|nr:NERD domain-containing protein [Marinilabiliales bacterium]